MNLFLGIDGGQSGTAALIGDATGRVLGAGEAGPCNHATAAEGRARLESALRGSIAGACAEAGLDPAAVQFASACYGLSGGPEDKQQIVTGIVNSRHHVFTNDAVIALAGATPAGQGIIVIAGTGSIALGRNAEYRSARAGGWGYIFGDEGSAFDISRQALRAVLRMDEGWGPPTALRAPLLEATASAAANEMLHLFYTPEWPRSCVATLAPLVDQAARAGDPIAQSILTAAAQHLAHLAAAVRSQLWPAGERVDIAYIGGVFRSGLVLERFRMLMELEQGSRCRPPLYGPAEGALLEAYRAVDAHLQPGFTFQPHR